MCVVIDLDVVCLICLQPNKEMTRIFSADGDDPELQIAQKISILSELKTNRSNKSLPSKICNSCLQDLKAAWRFRKNCQAAVTIFQTIVKLDVKPENIDPEELDEQHIKVPHGLQIKRINVATESEDETKDKELQKVSKADEVIATNDRVNSSLYEELESNDDESQDKEEYELQTAQNSNENDGQKESENDDECFVEYYITEEGATEEQTAEIEQKPFSKDSVVRFVNKQAFDPEEQLENMHQMKKRGRPKKQNVVLQEATEAPKVLRSKSKEKVIANITSSEEVREVKTRKRKSNSPETKSPKICEICGNSYRYQHALKAHMRRHFNDKPFPCECCDKAFVSNVELRRHMRVHTGQKPYACQYCDRRFSDFGSRIKHERTHTGERPYLCVTCGKSFAYPHVLSVHVLTHTGEKRFRCDYCTKGFTKKAYLLSHVNQHHSSFKQEIDETVSESEKDNTTSLEECVYTTELSNEIIDEEFEEDYVESGDIIISDSLITPKMEDDDGTEIQEIMEDEPNEFTITVR